VELYASVAFVGNMPVLLVKFKHLVHVPNAEIKQNIISSHYVPTENIKNEK
jgi:hypothetical protein